MFNWMTTVSEVSEFFFFNDTATTEIYTLSLHDALPIFEGAEYQVLLGARCMLQEKRVRCCVFEFGATTFDMGRSEEHTSELQSQSNLVCRLLLEKKKRIVCQLRLSLKVLLISRPQGISN